MWAEYLLSVYEKSRIVKEFSRGLFRTKMNNDNMFIA